MTDLGGAEQAAIVALSGPDCVVIGEIADVVLGHEGALAMSVGRHPKANPSIDPNEDAAFIAAGPRALLVVVADGHLGFNAAQAAVRALQAEAPILLGCSPRTAVQALELAMHTAEDAVAGALADVADTLQSSRTALTVAVAHPGIVHVCTVGDTAAFHVKGGGRSKLKRFRAEDRFLGPYHGPVRVDRRRWRVGDRLVIASDGLTDFTGESLIGQVAAAPAPPQTTARRLVEAALDGGAGDNVTVAVADLSALASAGWESRNSDVPGNQSTG